MSAREVVARRLGGLAAAFPDLPPAALQTGGLDDRNATLAHAVFGAVLRRWLTLECLLNSALRTPLRQTEPALQAVLLSGAAQLLFLDRIPPHAALNESVELAKRLVRAGAAGIVNAVLRKMAGLRAGPEAPIGNLAAPIDPRDLPRDALPLADGRWLPLSAPALPEDAMSRLAAATSCPLDLLRRWQVLHGVAEAVRLALHGLVAAPTILNTAHASSPLSGSLTSHDRPGSHLFTGSRPELISLLDSRRDLWVQDPGSSRAIASIAHLRPLLVVDFCAGQGTKTRQLAATFPQAEIIATDTDSARYETLRASFRDAAQVRILRPETLMREFVGRADLILLDVPCSNTGVLARRVEARYRCGREQLERLTGIQRQIIADAIPLLRTSPRGRILYSTCSIEPKENEGIIDWAVKWHRFRAESAATLLPAGLPGGRPAEYHDGAFAAVLA
jgi:16S rRNA (cytosine967-C5)-methyltransferase